MLTGWLCVWVPFFGIARFGSICKDSYSRKSYNNWHFCSSNSTEKTSKWLLKKYIYHNTIETGIPFHLTGNLNISIIFYQLKVETFRGWFSQLFTAEINNSKFCYSRSNDNMIFILFHLHGKLQSVSLYRFHYDITL